MVHLAELESEDASTVQRATAEEDGRESLKFAEEVVQWQLA